MEYFDYNYYISKYNDLKHLTKEQAINHFKNYGIKEQRKFNKLLENFDYNFYIKNYKDLNKMNYLEACNHYIKYGIKKIDNILNLKILITNYMILKIF